MKEWMERPMPCDEGQRIEVFNRTRGRCLYCGRELAFHAFAMYSERGAWVVDLFIPLSRGGLDRMENRAACCLACSHQKGDRLPWEFDPERFKEGVRDLGRCLEKPAEDRPSTGPEGA